MTPRHLIILNAALLISTGLALWFGPVSLLPEGYGFPAGPQAGSAAGASDGGYDPQALGRLLGAGCFGAGLLLLAVRDVGGSRFGRRVTGALCAAHTAGFMAALTQQISIWESPLGWITAGTLLAPSLGYGALAAVPQSSSTPRRAPVAPAH